MSETSEQRSRTMRAVRSRDTGPEMVVRQFLHAAGLRYRLHDGQLLGKPDLVFPSRRIALFVHGCFWHQHPHCARARMPKHNAPYWTQKLRRNVERDLSVVEALLESGWHVMVIWECETKDEDKLDRIVKHIREIPRH